MSEPHKPTATKAEGEREDVDEALERATESSSKPGHRMDHASEAGGKSQPIAGANEGESVEDAKTGKKSQAA